MSSEQARKEFEVARRIHLGSQGAIDPRREILSERADLPPTGGRKIGRQVLAAAMFLVALNVAFGLFIIARHESANPNREALRKQSEAQVRKALEQASASELTPAPLGISDTAVTVRVGAAAEIAEQVQKLAQNAGGTATPGPLDAGKINVLVEMAGGRISEFVKSLSAINGVKRVENGNGAAGPDEKMTLTVRIAEEQ